MRIVTPTSVARAINCFPGREIRLASSYHCGHFTKVLHYSSLRQALQNFTLTFPTITRYMQPQVCLALQGVIGSTRRLSARRT
jgi:hypothetical protein